jgi:peptide/nickel transport system substrate-binding protein
MSTDERIHPFVKQAQEKLYDGRISRREFLRLASLMGVSAASAWVLAACGAPTTAAPQPTTAPAAATVKRGGVIKIGFALQAVDHPARLSWTQGADVLRNQFEYLTLTDRNNVTTPYLLEKWSANDDATEWTLSLRPGIKWHNPGGPGDGEEFVAEHVKFNFGQWLNPDIGSSILGFFEGFLTMDGVQAKDDHTLVLQFSRPKVDVAENLFHYPAQIVHPSFDGDATTFKNAGTGPFRLVNYKVGEGARVEKREGYWQNGADGQPLPYLDAVEYIDLGTDSTPYIAALQSGQVHEYLLTATSYQSLKNATNVAIYPARTSQTRVMRMRVDVKPYDDNRVRSAIKMCQDRKKIVQTAYFGQADEGQDTHVAPVQPDYAPIESPKYDPEGAKALLKEAGYDSLDVEIAVGSDWTDIVAYIETLKEDAKAAGINVILNTMPQSAYWDVWTEAAVGVTPWTHRPLAVMLLPLAYIADSEGKPVPWNESRWVDAEFTELLQKAQGVADPVARREVMRDLERIQQERGSIGIAYWQNVWDAYNPAFQNTGAHPTGYVLLTDVWYDDTKDPFKQ